MSKNSLGVIKLLNICLWNLTKSNKIKIYICKIKNGMEPKFAYMMAKKFDYDKQKS